jgi:hypothetical protein
MRIGIPGSVGSETVLLVSERCSIAKELTGFNQGESQMVETFKLSATPFFFSQGKFKGMMRNVTFIAESPTHTKRWFAANFGHFERAFSMLVPLDVAKEMVASLGRGEDIEFPGLYEKKQFDYGFTYRATWALKL